MSNVLHLSCNNALMTKEQPIMQAVKTEIKRSSTGSLSPSPPPQLPDGDVLKLDQLYKQEKLKCK